MGSPRQFTELLTDAHGRPIDVEVRCQACGRGLGTYIASIGHEQLREGISSNEGIRLQERLRPLSRKPRRDSQGVALGSIGDGYFAGGLRTGARVLNHNAWVDPKTNRYGLNYEWRCGCGAHIKRRSTRLGKLPVHKDRGTLAVYL